MTSAADRAAPKRFAVQASITRRGKIFQRVGEEEEGDVARFRSDGLNARWINFKVFVLRLMDRRMTY